jgi:predicted metal-binding protein
MPKAVLFVCKSCRLSEDENDTTPSDGALLLDRLLALYQSWARQAELEIQPVGCLWTCSQACTVSLQSAEKGTYLLTNLSPSESAEALIQFSERFLDSQSGSVPWKKIPEILKNETIARIPAANQTVESEEEEE